MSNFYRTFRSANWSNLDFRRMTSDEKVVFVLIHTAEFSSETSVFFCPISECAIAAGLTQTKIRKIFQKFQELGYIYYDYEYEEICVKDFFKNSPPNSGIGYDRYVTDLDKIKSKKVLEVFVENTKQYRISLSFFTAMYDIMGGLDRDEYIIGKTSMCMEDFRTASMRGRKKSGIGIAKESETPVKSDSEIFEEMSDDDECPF